MATITLTDRISVRVTAKDSTESSAQKKRDGGNTAAALGGTGLTDSEKEELGDDLGETLTGEDGRTYARSDKVAGVLKKLKEDGALDEETTVYKYGASVASIPVLSLPYVTIPGSQWWKGFGPILEATNGVKLYVTSTYNINSSDAIEDMRPANIGAIHSTGSDNKIFILNLTELYNAGKTAENYAWIFTDGSQYAYKSRPYMETAATLFNDYATDSQLQNGSVNVPVTAVGNIYYRLDNYGSRTEETTGGPKVDPTGKTDAQIQKDLEDFAALNNCKMTSDSGDTYIAVTDANGNPLYFLGT